MRHAGTPYTSVLLVLVCRSRERGRDVHDTAYIEVLFARRNPIQPLSYTVMKMRDVMESLSLPQGLVGVDLTMSG